MKEELILFETAKLAKEKGFDEEVTNYYHPRYGLSDGCEDSYNREEQAEGYYSAPTQSLLQRWLREVHRIYLYISLSGTKEISWFWSINDKKYQDGSNNNYEEALEAGLLEALKLINRNSTVD